MTVSKMFTRALKVSDISSLLRIGCAATVLSTVCGLDIAKAAEQAPLVLDKTIVIPGVPVGPYSDVLSVDVSGNRIFATPQAAKTVAILNFKEGRVIKTIPGFGKLHAVFYLPDRKRFYVSDGATGELKVFDGETYALISTMHLAVGADSIAYDPRRKLLYVANGGEDAGMDHSLISVIDPEKNAKIADIPIPADNLEAIAVSADGKTLFANLVDDAAVAEVNLNTARVSAIWKLPSNKLFPFALAVDDDRNRLYVTCREDLKGFGIGGSLLALDSKTGRVVRSESIGGWADGAFIDAKRNRLYVTTGVGTVDTFELGAGDSLKALPKVPIPLIAKHGVFSPELDTLFVDAPHLASTEAQVVVLKAVH